MKMINEGRRGGNPHQNGTKRNTGPAGVSIIEKRFGGAVTRGKGKSNKGRPAKDCSLEPIPVKTEKALPGNTKLDEGEGSGNEGETPKAGKAGTKRKKSSGESTPEMP